MKKLIICGLLLACSLTGTAQTFFNVEGIRYMIEDDHAVIARQDRELTGDIVIPGTVTYEDTEYPVTRLMSSDDDGAFHWCEITSISLPANITEIPNFSFMDCWQLRSVVLLGPVTRIGEYSFNNCEALTTINLPDEITVIANSAFHGCRSLSSVTIPQHVTTIDSYAFAECSGLTSVTIGNGVTSIDCDAFNGCSNLSSINVAEENLYFSSEKGILFDKNKSTLLHYPQGKTETSYVIPNSVTTIDRSAFDGCSGLTSITIPNNVTSIGYRAFQNCSGLTSVTIPNSVTSIGDGAFEGCSGLTSPVYNATLFAYMPTIYSGAYNIPDGIKEICGEAFRECSGLTSVTIPNSVTSIGGGAFEGCNSLTSPVYNATLFAYMPTIYSGAYNIPDGIKEICGFAFRECSGLTSVTFPNSVTSIGSGAFQNCSGLTSIIIPNSVTSIDNGAFQYCSSLTSITIPNSVTTIGSGAFDGCSGLTKISIGRNVNNIEWGAFRGCQNLSEVWCYTLTVPTTNPDAFTESNYTNATLFVRNTILEEFRNAEPWNSFSEINNISSDYAPYHTFFKAGGIRYMTEDDEVVIARQDRELTGDFVIPAKVTYGDVEYNVTRLMSPEDSESGGGGAFQECEITSISLPASITEIPDNTFNDCKLLNSVTLLGPVTRIGRYSFFGCEALTTINLPDDVTEMGDAAFCRTGLTEFKIPTGVTTLNWEVLAQTKITYLEIPATVDYLCGDCFATRETDEQGLPLRRTVKMFQRDCRLINGWDGRSEFGDMTTIDLLVPKGSKVLYQEYFPWLNMHSITEYGEDTGEVLVPDQRHVTIEGLCYMLKDGEAHVDIQPATLSGEVTIPEKVTYEDIDYPVTTIMSSYGGGWLGTNYYEYSSIFSQTQVTKVILPTSIKTIGHHAFCKSPQLQEVVLNEGITEIGVAAFALCPELTTINIPSTVSILKDGVLRGCPKLTTFTLHEGLTCINSEALFEAGIETLTIPSTCTLLGYRAFMIPNLKTLYLNVKEPTDIKADGATMSSTVFGYEDATGAQEFLSNVDLIVPLGCAETYKSLTPWFYFRSITDAGCPYLKLNNSVFSAPEGVFTITNTENNGEPEFEQHNAEYEETFTHGLCIKEGTTVSFSTTAENSLVYVYLFSDNSGTVKLDGTEMSEIGDDQSETNSYRRYDIQVSSGDHTITCNTYEGDQWPCMFLLQVQDASGDYYQPKTIRVNIDGINYMLHETINDQNETVRTATVARQKTSLSGDITIPAKVSYAKKVLQDNEWVTLEALDYEVTGMVVPSFEISQVPGIHRTTDGAFQECQISSICLPATITTIPAGAFNGCQQLKTVTLPEGIITIGGGAFANCTSLEEIYLPETITDMGGWYIFGDCPNLKKVNIPKLVTTLGNGCFMRSGIETFIIPKSITSIGEACFGTEWEDEASSIKNIKICHESFTDGSFSFPEGIFNKVSDMTLIVPKGTKESLYSQVYPWKDFGTIIEYTDQNDEHQYNAYRMEFEEEAEEVEPEEEAEEEAEDESEKEETPATGRRRAPAKNVVETVGFTPSGVAPELPTEIEKDGKKYTVTYKEAPTIMPANDVVLKVILTPVGGKGDINGDGNVDIADIVGLSNYLMGGMPNNFKEAAADVNEDGFVNANDIIAIMEIIMGK